VATFDRPRLEFRTPIDLVTEVRSGVLRIPPFQRGYKWEASDVTELFDSLMRGYPIGELLLWRQPAPAARLLVGPVSIDAPALDYALWVVDGQQRIISLVGALVAAETSTDPRFRIYLDVEDGAFNSAGVRQQPSSSWVPVNVLLDPTELRRWLQDNAGWLSEQHLSIVDRAADAIREYPISSYVVTSPDEASLAVIFRRMNGPGKPLTKVEVFAALHSGLAGDQPLDLRGLARIPAELGFGALDERSALRCLLAFRGGDIRRDDYEGEFSSPADRADTFRELAAVLRDVVAFLRGAAGIPHVRLLPHKHVLPVLVRFVRTHGAPEGRAARLLRRWLWRGAAAAPVVRAIGPAGEPEQVRAAGLADPLAAARALLREVPTVPGFEIDLDELDITGTSAKVNLLGLLAAAPRNLRTGAPIDTARLLESGSPLQPILARGTTALADSIANRAVANASSGPDLRRMLIAAAPGVAASHLVDDQGQRLLAAGADDEFLARRAEAVTGLIKSHIDQMAEWGARDGPAMSDVIHSVAPGG
jgi:hypothetical protein